MTGITLFKVRIKVKHQYAYQPNGCTTATATQIFWERDHKRFVVQLEYDNGAIDWIPLEELGKIDFYERLDEK